MVEVLNVLAMTVYICIVSIMRVLFTVVSWLPVPLLTKKVIWSVATTVNSTGIITELFFSKTDPIFV